MKTVLFATALVFLSFMYTGSTYAQAVTCDSVLLQNVIITEKKSQSQFAWLKIVNRDNYSTAKESGSAAIPDLFSGDYDSFSEKRNKYLSKEKYETSIDDARQEVRIQLPIEAIGSWEKCVISNSHGLFAWINDADEYGATLGIGWKPSPGLDKELSQIKVNLMGGECNSLTNDLKILPRGEKMFAITRSNTRHPIRGTINGVITSTSMFKETITGSYSAKFYIPPLPEIPSIVQVKEPVAWALDGYGGWPRTNDCNMDTSDNDIVPVHCVTTLIEETARVRLKVYFRCKEQGGDHTKFKGTRYWVVYNAPADSKIVKLEGIKGKNFSFTKSTHGRSWGYYDFKEKDVAPSYWESLQFRVDSQGCDDKIVGVGGTLRFTVVLEK